MATKSNRLPAHLEHYPPSVPSSLRTGPTDAYCCILVPCIARLFGTIISNWDLLHFSITFSTCDCPLVPFGTSRPDFQRTYTLGANFGGMRPDTDDTQQRTHLDVWSKIHEGEVCKHVQLGLSSNLQRIYSPSMYMKQANVLLALIPLVLKCLTADPNPRAIDVEGKRRS